jgi:hypothetical protein
VTDENFPVDGFKFGIPGLPEIGYSQIWKYLIEDVEIKKQLSFYSNYGDQIMIK